MLSLGILYSVVITITSSLNLIHGRLQYSSHKADAAISFLSLTEYKLFLKYNNLDYNEPGYLVKLTEANKHKYSACLDGSPQAFYYRPGFGDGIRKFNIYLQGGGWCQGIEASSSPSCDQSCVYRALYNDRGTSNTDEPYLYFPESGDGYLSNIQQQNPLTYNWNTVYVRYCDGMSFSGNNHTILKSADQNQSIYFRGFRNLNAVFRKLIANYAFDKATDVQLTGSSAGGLAVFLHADYIKHTFLSDTVQNYIAMPDSGFFMDYEGSGKYDSCMKWNYEWQNVSVALDTNCVHEYSLAGLEWKCLFAPVLSPFIGSRIFALQSQYDGWQISSELRDTQNITAINEYGANLTDVFITKYIKSSKQHFGYLESCKHHTGGWNMILIDNYTSSTAEIAVFSDNKTHNNLWFQNHSYPCVECCGSNAF